MNTVENSPLRNAFVNARESAEVQFADVVSGWRPKNPNPNEQEIIAFVESLSGKQKEQCSTVISHYVEAALFKLMVRLEEGFPDSSFRISSKSEASGEIEVYVDDDINRDLIHAFWRWMKKKE